MSAFSTADEQFMQRALQLADQASAIDEVPVGAVLVEQGKVIGEGFNALISSSDCTAHAEIQAIRQACAYKSNYRLPNTTLYVSLEPCAMCAGAIVHARVDRVVIATHEPRAGAAGSVLNLLQHDEFNHRCKVDFGLFQEDSASKLKTFFKSKR
jgi:tRNA(adenine34) deaminase